MNTNLLYKEEIAVSHTPRPTGNPLADEALEGNSESSRFVGCPVCADSSNFDGETCPACGQPTDKKLTDDKKYSLVFLAIVFVAAFVFVFYLYKKGYFKRTM